MLPAGGSFATSRAGFTVLHPIKGIAGRPLEVTHAGGRAEQAAFPLLISPVQPVFDIQRLAYGHDGFTATVAFSGEVFEMEDQRSWSDASCKIYCAPLVHPFTYEIAGDKSYRLGLVSIGMRTNPYGAAATENLRQFRRTMAHEDPRQRGLFAAAWAVGVLAATATGHEEAHCLGAAMLFAGLL